MRAPLIDAISLTKDTINGNRVTSCYLKYFSCSVATKRTFLENL